MSDRLASDKNDIEAQWNSIIVWASWIGPTLIRRANQRDFDQSLWGGHHYSSKSRL